MKKQVLIIILVAIILSTAIIASLSNPSKEDFSNWVKEQYVSKLTSENIGLGDVVMVFAGNSIIKQISTTDNYVFFSIFNLPSNNNETVKFLGLFNNFIALSNEFYSSTSSIE